MSNAVNIVRLELPFGQEPPMIHCPVCGKSVNVDGELVACDHLVYFFLTQTGEFIYLRKDVRKQYADLKVYDLETGLGYDRLICDYQNDSLLKMELTYGGMACGPIWFTDYVGFDFTNKAKLRLVT